MPPSAGGESAGIGSATVTLAEAAAPVDSGGRPRAGAPVPALGLPVERLAVYTEPVYTVAVLDGSRGFDWDMQNVGHVARHRVSPAEVEEAVERPHASVCAKDDGTRSWCSQFVRNACGRLRPKR